MCEYEVNLSTNEKVITENKTNTNCYRTILNIKVISNSVCEYEVNPLTNDKVIAEIQNLKAK